MLFYHVLHKLYEQRLQPNNIFWLHCRKINSVFYIVVCESLTRFWSPFFLFVGWPKVIRPSDGCHFRLKAFNLYLFFITFCGREIWHARDFVFQFSFPFSIWMENYYTFNLYFHLDFNEKVRGFIVIEGWQQVLLSFHELFAFECE